MSPDRLGDLIVMYNINPKGSLSGNGNKGGVQFRKLF